MKIYFVRNKHLVAWFSKGGFKVWLWSGFSTTKKLIKEVLRCKISIISVLVVLNSGLNFEWCFQGLKVEITGFSIIEDPHYLSILDGFFDDAVPAISMICPYIPQPPLGKPGSVNRGRSRQFLSETENLEYLWGIHDQQKNR